MELDWTIVVDIVNTVANCITQIALILGAPTVLGYELHKKYRLKNPKLSKEEKQKKLEDETIAKAKEILESREVKDV